MCGVSTPSMPRFESPPSIEPVKKIDTDAVKVREDARKRATSVFGIPGTDVTKGSLAAPASQVQKTRTLGA